MSALRNVAQGFRNLWGAAEEEYEDAPESFEERETISSVQSESSYREPSPERDSSRSEHSPSRSSDRYERLSARASSHYTAESSHGGSGASSQRLRPVAMPLRATREKNIYTLKPKSLDESSLAADYLKTGCAVIINLEEVEKAIAIRIIDFMSGVCYGLENQGHAMKLGEKIFLFTPGDFELSSDETDYAENRDLIFKDVAPESAPEPALGAAERRSWER